MHLDTEIPMQQRTENKNRWFCALSAKIDKTDWLVNRKVAVKNG
jgi:hypothetical protein